MNDDIALPPINDIERAIRTHDDALLDEALTSGVDSNGPHAFSYNKASTTVHFAAAFATPDAIRKIVAAGGNVHARDLQGTTPLMRAVYTASSTYLDFAERALDNAQALLDAGARIDEPMNSGDTPLHIAAGNGNVTAVRWLVARGHPLNPVSIATDKGPAMTPYQVVLSLAHDSTRQNPHIRPRADVLAVLAELGADTRGIDGVSGGNAG